ncbi:Beta-expansin [Heracleum sosnowskyi]|uniref:Beta-expansin n=1 Tax=Heracleum sosnowskyi TaxID=360622 RepID=A0AAD8M9P0_9APIA|nr:Beta-expansin [Heracleum sosnowskyi]
MASSLQLILILTLSSHLMVYEGNAATCSNCFLHSQAVYYPNSDQHGTENGACGFGRFGATINHGYVSAASNLYRGGIGCGACYQVRCTNGNFCSDEGVKVVITNQGSGPGDFILSRKAFARMGESKYDAASLLALGVVDIEYKRIPCSYPNKNIIMKIDENSDYPYYLAFILLYQQGTKDITAVKLCEPKKFVCKLLSRSYGAVWATTSPPTGALSIRMLLSDDSGDDTWVAAANNLPKHWKAGKTYDTGVQVIDL